MKLSEFFEKHVPAGTVLGIVGCGKCGEELLHYALEHKAEVLLCDPPRAEAEGEEEWSNTCELWGNGMGGKVYDRDEFLTFLPLEYLLKHAHILCILVPENTVLFTEETIQKIPSSMKIFNFSGEGIFSPEALPYCTEVCFPEVSVNFREQNAARSAKQNNTPKSSK